MGIHDLRVEHGESQIATLLDHRPKCNFALIAARVEHRFGAEATAQCQAIRAADELVALPNLAAMPPSIAVHVGECLDQFLVDPVFDWPSATAHYKFKLRVESDNQIAPHRISACGP